jgi:hypothetical protein
MNPPAKILLAAALLLGAHARAEFVRQDGHWQVKPGTTADVTPPSRLPVLLLAMDHASERVDAGDVGGAIKEWEIIGEANVGAEAEAVSLLTRARLHAGRGEFEKATTFIDDIFARHSGFPAFAGAVDQQLDIANRLTAAASAGGSRGSATARARSRSGRRPSAWPPTARMRTNA